MDYSADTLAISAPSTEESVEAVVAAAQAWAEAHALEDEAAYRFVLLASEAVTNAIIHGNRNDPSKTVRFSAALKGDRLEMTIEDEGEGFEWSRAPDPLAPENLLLDHGRGMFLLHTMAESVAYEEGGRRLRIGISLQGPSATAAS